MDEEYTMADVDHTSPVTREMNSVFDRGKTYDVDPEEEETYDVDVDPTRGGPVSL